MGKKKKEEKKEKARKKEHAAIGPADVSGAIVQAARSIRTVLSRNLLSSGLYAGQDGVMLALAEGGGMTAGALAARLGVKAPTMTRTIGRLEAQGFVERRPDTTDGRLTVVDLTRAGSDSLEKIAQACDLSERQALEGLSEKEVRTLLKLLRTVDGNLRGVVVQDGDKAVAEEF
ncbi:DNA-binding MarR family transcriptional regulator [Rhizobium azooxidifex]|uniref:DNA-binding MarR family transcriptional regulator n=1 Tax=Mycoplana azooxidifex TaxID=1636188 RepID=A0A7W6D7L8_9HYPH|nr:MarR family winged helix-turn-helix transcriptional regulator [Mycoplana azooxidifex]MBB3977439.1 DNA-binding MarR family transcriptional regulator [Mycoplana azooxidifex]